MYGEALPVDWYHTSLSGKFNALFFEEGGEEKVELALAMLKPDSGDRRILDLACATGRRALELSRRGFEVVGIDTQSCLLEVPAVEASQEGLDARFEEEDPRYIEFDQEFDLILSLGGGSFEHFDYDEENLRAFKAAARALRVGGRLLMQLPNVIFIEEHLPPRTWLQGNGALELIDQGWDETTRRLVGTRKSLLEEESYNDTMSELVALDRRIYSVEELAEIFETVGLILNDVYDENGAPCTPTDVQREIYVEAVRWTVSPEGG